MKPNANTSKFLNVFSELSILYLILFFSLLFVNSAVAQTTGTPKASGEEEKNEMLKLWYNRGGKAESNASLTAEQFAKIEGLLEKFKRDIPMELQSPFNIEGSAAEGAPKLTHEQAARLSDHSKIFFNELKSNNITLRELQAFSNLYSANTRIPGDNIGKSSAKWVANFRTIERSLMGGRTFLIQDLWKKTLMNFFQDNPKAKGVIYGQMDIGSWVKCSINGLDFAGDIDFSTMSTDPKTNLSLREYFASNLQKSTGLDMVAIDVMLTAHGSATADVFIGDWGKAFAEVSVLKLAGKGGKIKLIEPKLDAGGNVTDITEQYKDPMEVLAEGGIAKNYDDNTSSIDPDDFDPKEKFKDPPALTAEHEPMLSLEMLRHSIHDIEKGPFMGVQKIIKMMKYTERSFYVMNEVKKNLEAQGITYESDANIDVKLGENSEKIVNNKKYPEVVVRLIEEMTGPIKTDEALDLAVKDLTVRCKNAMLANAHRGFTFRITQISAIRDETRRQEAADEFLKQLDQEYKEGYAKNPADFPPGMTKAMRLLFEIKGGKLTDDQVKIRMDELDKVMKEYFKLDKKYWEVWVLDPYVKLANYIEKNKLIVTSEIDLFIKDLKQVYKDSWRRLMPDWVQQKTATTLEFTTSVRDGLERFNKFNDRTTLGRALNHNLMNKGDIFLTFYEAFASGKTPKESAINIATTSLQMYAQQKMPPLAIPMSFYSAYQEGSVMPAVGGVIFYTFPMVGQLGMIAGHFNAIVVPMVQDADFRKNLNAVASMGVYENGHLTRFKVPRPASGWVSGSNREYFETDDIPFDGKARADKIKDIFNNGEMAVVPEMYYFYGIVPDKNDNSVLYKRKMETLGRFLAFDNDFVTQIHIIKEIKSDKNEFRKTWPADQYESLRIQQLDSMENALQDGLWLSIANGIENMMRSQDTAIVNKYERALKKIEEDLFLTDSTMKKFGRKGLLTKIKDEIKKDSYSFTKSSNAASSGAGFQNVAVPTYELYLDSYNKINKISDQIRKLWRDASGLTVNCFAAISDPVKTLIAGDGAPELTGAPDEDLKLSYNSFDRHSRLASYVTADLAKVLGKPVDAMRDRIILKTPCQLAYEFEHLNDDKVNNPDAWEEYGVLVADNSRSFEVMAKEIKTKTDNSRKTVNPKSGSIWSGPAKSLEGITSDLQTDNYLVSAETIRQMLIRRKSYADYLEDLKNKPFDLRLLVKGDKKATAPAMVPLSASVTDSGGKPAQLPEGTRIEWFGVKGETETRLADGISYTASVVEAGTSTYLVKIVNLKSGKEIDKQFWSIEAVGNEKPGAKGGDKIRLVIPGKIKQYEIVEATVELPAEIKNNIKELSVQGDISGIENTLNPKLQFKFAEGYLDSKTKTWMQPDSTEIYVTLKVKDLKNPGYSNDLSFSKKVIFENQQLAVSTVDSWQGGADATSFGLSHKGIKMAPRTNVAFASRPTDRVQTANAGGSVNMRPANNDIHETIHSPADLKVIVEKEFNYNNDKNLVAKAYKVAGFEGFVVETGQANFSGGSASSNGFINSYATKRMVGYVMKGNVFFRVECGSVGMGWYDNSDKDWVINNTEKVFGEAQAILQGVTFKTKGGVTFSTYKGPALDGSEDPYLTIEPKRDTIRLSETVNLSAVIKNDKPSFGPYAYKWGGQIQGADDKSGIQLVAKRPGKYQVSVNVTGNYSPGSATMEYVVPPAKIGLVKKSPVGDKINVGTPVELQADLSGIANRGGKLMFQWQPSPEEEFEPAEGVTSSTKVIFSKPGLRKVWVQVIDKTSADEYILGESETVELDIVMPGIKLEFIPKNAFPGAQVTAKVVSDHPLDGASYRWNPIDGKLGKQIGESNDGSSITFIPNSTQPIDVVVKLLSKDKGDQLGEVNNRFIADHYRITTEGPKLPGPKPMVWIDGVGLVESEKGISVDQIVEFKAVVTPVPSETLTYSWKVTEGEATISNPTSRDARFTASRPGNIQGEVIVKGKDGMVLGSTNCSFAVTISGDELKKGVAKKNDYDKKLIQLNQLLQQGQAKDAVRLGDELLTISAKDGATLKPKLAAACAKAAKDSAYQRDFSEAEILVQKGLTYLPDDANLKTRLTEAKNWKVEWLKVTAQGDKVKDAISQKNLPKAITEFQAFNDLQIMMPGGIANRYSQQLLKERENLNVQYRQTLLSVNSNWANAANSKHWQVGLTVLDTHQKEWTLFDADAINFKGLINLANNEMAKQDKVYTTFIGMKNDMKSGKPAPARGTPFYIQYDANQAFATDDKRYIEMMDFANALNDKQTKPSGNEQAITLLTKDAAAMEFRGDLEGALSKYKEAQQLKYDQGTAAKINTLEAEVNRRNKISEATISGEPKKKKKGFIDFLNNVAVQVDALDKALNQTQPSTGSSNPDISKPQPRDQPAPTSGSKNETTIPAVDPVKIEKGIAAVNGNEEEKIWDNWNIGSVGSGPSKPTVIQLKNATYISRMENYHYVNRGTKPGTVGLRNSAGTLFGPWQAYGITGQGGVVNAVWAIQPNVTLPAGDYTVVDSGPETWSCNSQSENKGFTNVWRPKNKNLSETDNQQATTSANTQESNPDGVSIRGRIYRPDGEPAYGARVSYGTSAWTLTNSKGEFTLYYLMAGEVEISSSFNGHHQNTVKVNLPSNQIIDIIIKLPPD